MENNTLGQRMKIFYEEVPKTKLMRKTPVILRLDGRSFHTFTKNFKKPFDDILIHAMQETMLALCKNIQGCRLGYVQSDEISLLLCDYDKLTSSAWFDYEVQKMCSISASMATLYFNKAFSDLVYLCTNDSYKKVLLKAVDKGAMFDSRCFNLPKEEVTNYFLWRQLDASRNSIQMLARSYFTHKELHKQNSDNIQNMLFDKHGVNWNDLEPYKKRGSACIKVDGQWIIDNEIPVWKCEDREYIEKLVYKGEAF